jgi:hypothetical protein
MALKTAVGAHLNGLKVAAADIEDLAVTVGKLAGSITNAKLVNSEYVYPVTWTQATPAAISGCLKYQVFGAAEIVEVCFGAVANGTSGATVIDVHAGPNVASAVSIFATAKLNVGKASTLKTAAPSGTKGVIADNGVIMFYVDSVASGAKSNWTVTAHVKQSLTT